MNGTQDKGTYAGEVWHTIQQTVKGCKNDATNGWFREAVIETKTTYGKMYYT